MEPCPKCSTPTVMGFGLAGGGYGAYSYCPKCEAVVQKWQEEDNQAPAPKDETAWLIEFFGHGSPAYYGKTEEGLGMTGDHSVAVRFARKEDADMVIDDFGWTRPNVQAIEHMWCGPTLHSLAAKMALR